VDAGGKLGGECFVDEALPRHPIQTGKRVGNDRHREMGFSFGPRTGMSRMPVRLVDDDKAGRREALQAWLRATPDRTLRTAVSA